MRDYSLIVQARMGPSTDKCPLYRIAGCLLLRGFEYTVEPPLTDPPRSGQPLYSGQVPCSD